MSDEIAVELLPEVGAKITSLRNLATGREWLWHNPAKPIVAPPYGGLFRDYDISGYDDCFPGIGEGPYPAAPWLESVVPDHGEWWCLPWAVEAHDEGVTLSLHGVRFPYHADKRLWIEPGGIIRLAYRVENPTPFPFYCMWSAHPLFEASSATRVVLPTKGHVLVDFSLGDRLGAPLDSHNWPLTHDAHGRPVDLSRLTPGAGQADKLYATALEAGWCALHDEHTGDYVGFTFDLREVPYVGIWLNQDAWPSPDQPCFNVALEPCNGYPDRVDIAQRVGALEAIGPYSTRSWQLAIHLGCARTLPSAVFGA